MILIVDINGSANITPPIPQKEPKNIKEKMANNGLMSTLSPTIFGVIILPSTI